VGEVCTVTDPPGLTGEYNGHYRWYEIAGETGLYIIVCDTNS
jgi:hypothetical protein